MNISRKPAHLVVGPRVQTDVNRGKNGVCDTVNHAFKALQRWQNYTNIALPKIRKSLSVNG